MPAREDGSPRSHEDTKASAEVRRRRAAARVVDLGSEHEPPETGARLVFHSEVDRAAGLPQQAGRRTTPSLTPRALRALRALRDRRGGRRGRRGNRGNCGTPTE